LVSDTATHNACTQYRSLFNFFVALDSCFLEAFFTAWSAINKPTKAVGLWCHSGFSKVFGFYFKRIVTSLNWRGLASLVIAILVLDSSGLLCNHNHCCRGVKRHHLLKHIEFDRV
jgi:hypothetical protein